MAKSPTELTLERLREHGWQAQVVQYWNPHARRRVDLFGFGDVIACHPQQGILLVQATTWDHAASRKRKIEHELAQKAIAWLRSGGQIQVWGWKKFLNRKEGKWYRYHRIDITADDVPQRPVQPRIYQPQVDLPF